jgi:hypothetical protein
MKRRQSSLATASPVSRREEIWRDRSKAAIFNEDASSSLAASLSESRIGCNLKILQYPECEGIVVGSRLLNESRVAAEEIWRDLCLLKAAIPPMKRRHRYH